MSQSADDPNRPTDPLNESLLLLREAQAGDNDALNRLLGRYHDRVLRLVRVRLGARLRRRIESVDVAQNVLLTAARAYEKFEVREESSLIYWLARIAENEVQKQVGFHRRQRRDPDREADQTHADPPDPATPSRAAVREEEKRLLEHALDTLPIKQRELIVQRDYLHASWDAIAEDLGYASPEVARVSHSRAVITLGKTLRAGNDRSLNPNKRSEAPK